MREGTGVVTLHSSEMSDVRKQLQSPSIIINYVTLFSLFVPRKS